jgi:hypothetical protein
MKVGDLYPSKYLKASDLDGQEYALVMSHVDMEQMPDGEHKAVLYFSNANKGLVLNKTNAEMIALMHGGETDDWQGHKITLKPDKTQMGGKIVDCIRVVWAKRTAANGVTPAPATPTPARAFQAEQQRRQAESAQAPADPLGDDPLDGDKVPF